MDRSKWRIMALYFIVIVLLGGVVYGFQHVVREELWNQAMGSIGEATEQGRNALRVHLDESESSLNRLKARVENMESLEELSRYANSLGETRWRMRVYLKDGTVFPDQALWDETAFQALTDRATYGLIDPHMNRSHGIQVFDMYVPFRLRDGSEGYLLREFPLDMVLRNFTLSFYNGQGYAYVINRKGDILFHEDHAGKHVSKGNLFPYLADASEHPEGLTAFMDAVAISRSGSSVVNLEGRPVWLGYMPLDESASWYLVTVVPMAVLQAESDRILSVTILLSGIISISLLALLLVTMRHRRISNQAIQDQKNYSAHIFNHVTEGIALLDTEAPYCIRKMNPAGRKILGIPSDMSVEGEIFRHVFDAVDGRPLTQLVKTVIESGESRLFECEGYGPTGKYMYLAGGLERHKDSEGKDTLIANFHDITERKSAEREKEALHRSEKQTLLAAVSDTYPFIAAMDLTTDRIDFIWMNGKIQEKHTIGEKASDLYQWAYERIAKEHQEAYANMMNAESVTREFESGKRMVWLEYKFTFSDGSTHWLSARVVRIPDDMTHHMRVVYLTSIVDEQKAEEEEQRNLLETSLASAHAANEAKSRFLSNMSHDIRTPMNAIIGMSELLTHDAGDKEKVLSYSEKISASGKQLLSLINDILDMSKIESGKTVLHLTDFTIEEIGEQVETVFRPLAEQKKQAFRISMEAMKGKRYEGDFSRVLQVLNNVVSNAVKYTPEGGLIDVSIASLRAHPAHYGRFAFRVADNGIGMTKEFQAHLFDAFSRDEAHVSGIQGTGLGMAITKNLVELMGGTIHVDSEIGKGSTFEIILDFKVAKGNPAAAAESAIVDEDVLAGMHFLCAEDNELNAEILTELLHMNGATCVIAENGKKAVDLFENSPAGTYDMILMDVQMPVMNGYEATRAIRASGHKEAKDIPIIAMTANAFAEDIQKSLQSGMNAHVSKPIDMDTVKKAVAMLKACREKKCK